MRKVILTICLTLLAVVALLAGAFFGWVLPQIRANEQRSQIQFSCTSAKDPEDQLLKCRDMIERYPTLLAEGHFHRAWAYHGKREHDHAIAEVDKAIAANPNNSLYYSRRAIYHKDKGNIDQAISDYDQAIKLNPKDAGSYAMRGRLRAKRNPKEALADLDEAIRLDPNDLFNLTLSVQTHAEMRDWERVIADCSKIIALRPTADAYYMRGMALAEAKKYEQAKDDLRKALQIDQSHVRAREGLRKLGAEP
jgi:tetratricopeptide (TPR) repeat protein